MKNREKILKYLSGLMDEIEKNEFVTELGNNTHLRNEYEKIKAEIEDLRIEPRISDEYFNYLQVVARNRIAKKKKGKTFKFLFGLTTTFAIVILFFVMKISSGNEINNTKISELNDLQTNVLLNNLYDDDLDLVINSFTLSDYENSVAANIDLNEAIDFIDEELSSLPIEFIIENLDINSLNPSELLNVINNKKLF